MLNKEEQIEVKAFAKKHNELSTSCAITLLNELEKASDLRRKIHTLQAGLLAFVMQIKKKEAKEN